MVESDGFTFRILGPVHVTTAEGSIVFARRQHLDLLGLLLLRVDHVLSVADIVDAMWGQAAPRTAGAQVTNIVSALRAALIHGHRRLAVVERCSAGYRLRICDGRLDFAAFNALTAQARTAPPAEATTLLRRALDLWRGRHALGGIRAPYADAARVHLQEQRNTTLEALLDAELICGNHAKIVPELTEAVAAHPGRERLITQLMTALYRCGRTTDALNAYRQARKVLADEYGLEPSTALRDLERLILLRHPTLDGPGIVAGPGVAAVSVTPMDGSTRPEARGSGPGRAHPAPVPAQLPPDVRGFVGRAAELAELDALVSDPGCPTVISVVMGGAGVGKTTLAVHWAHRLRARYPDGQLYVNLRGFDPAGPAMGPTEALRAFLDALAVPAERIPAGLPERTALFRSLLAERRMLLVLDNAINADQVRPLLPGGAGCLVVVTSRSRLTSLVVAEGAHPVTLGPLTEHDALSLLAARLGHDRVAAEERAAVRIAAQCARLPLALAVVAARAAIHRTFSLAALTAELADTGALEGLTSPESEIDVRTVFSWSYEQLSPDAARLFRLLGLHPGPHVTLASAASIAAVDLATARALLSELTNAHLIGEHSPGQYTAHDLLRAYAAELSSRLDPSPARGAASHRVLDHYLHSADQAATHLYPHRHRIALPPADRSVTCEAIASREQALAWFTAEHPALVMAVEHASTADLSRHAWQIAATIGMFLFRQGHWHDWIGTQLTAIATAERLNDLAGRAHTHSGLGLAQMQMNDLEAAESHLGQALELFTVLEDGLALALAHVRASMVSNGLGRPGDALRHSKKALAFYQAAGHRLGEAQTLNNLGWYSVKLGRYGDAVELCERSIALQRELGNPQGVAHSLDSLGVAHYRLGNFKAAVQCHQESAQIFRESGYGLLEGTVLTNLGDALHATGDVDGAGRVWRDALHIFEELDHPKAGEVRTKLAISP